MVEIGGSLKLLAPNFPPLRVDGLVSWSDTFSENLFLSEHASVVTGYASEDSLAEIILVLSDLEVNAPKLKRFDFFLGMAFFDGLTERQKSQLDKLNRLLQSQNLGRVFVPTEISVHTKSVLFEANGSKSLTLGSSNFSALMPVRRSELDVVISGKSKLIENAEQYFELVRRASLPLDGSLLKAIPTTRSLNTRLLAVDGVSKHEFSLDGQTLGVSFDLPVKPTPSSNLNKYFAKARGSIPRSWYEVEINVPSTIGRASGFPSALNNDRNFNVYTHDGYIFPCHVSGGPKPHFNKNFESDGGLTVLGYWIKGLLLATGVIDEGEIVTEGTLKAYGRSYLKLTKIASLENSWFLDFGRQ